MWWNKKKNKKEEVERCERCWDTPHPESNVCLPHYLQNPIRPRRRRMNIICPCCKKIDFMGMSYNRIHMHLAECSKESVDRIVQDQMIYMRAYLNMAPLPDPPVYVPSPRDRRLRFTGRRKVNYDRRVKNRGLYTLVESEFLHSGIAHAGHYLNINGYAHRDRRKNKGLGRRQGSKDRRKQ